MRSDHFLKLARTTSQDLSSADLDYTTDFVTRFTLETVTIRASVDISEIIELVKDSAEGSEYDVVLDSWTLVSEKDYVFRPQGECNFYQGDQLRVKCSNANLTGTVYVEIRTS